MIAGNWSPAQQCLAGNTGFPVVRLVSRPGSAATGSMQSRNGSWTNGSPRGCRRPGVLLPGSARARCCDGLTIAIDPYGTLHELAMYAGSTSGPADRDQPGGIQQLTGRPDHPHLREECPGQG